MTGGVLRQTISLACLLLLLVLAGSAHAQGGFMPCEEAVELPEFRPLLAAFEAESERTKQEFLSVMANANPSGRFNEIEEAIGLMDPRQEAKEELAGYESCLALNSKEFLTVHSDGYLYYVDIDHPIHSAASDEDGSLYPAPVHVVQELTVGAGNRLVVLEYNWMRQGFFASGYIVLQFLPTEGKTRFSTYDLIGWSNNFGCAGDPADGACGLPASSLIYGAAETKRFEAKYGDVEVAADFIGTEADSKQQPVLVFSVKLGDQRPFPIKFGLNEQYLFVPASDPASSRN